MNTHKHGKQMTYSERDVLKRKARSMLRGRGLHFTEHMQIRMQQHKITQKHINLLKKGFDIVEYHEESGPRYPTLVIKSREKFEGNYIVMVLVLTTGCIKTVWLNREKGTGESVDMERYNANFKIKYRGR